MIENRPQILFTLSFVEIKRYFNTECPKKGQNCNLFSLISEILRIIYKVTKSVITSQRELGSLKNSRVKLIR